MSSRAVDERGGVDGWTVDGDGGGKIKSAKASTRGVAVDKCYSDAGPLMM